MIDNNLQTIIDEFLRNRPNTVYRPVHIERIQNAVRALLAENIELETKLKKRTRTRKRTLTELGHETVTHKQEVA